MEKREYKFDKVFLKEKLIEAKEKLTAEEVDIETKEDIQFMIDTFEEFLSGVEKETPSYAQDLTDTQMAENLANKFKQDLETVKIDFWDDIRYLYEKIDLSMFEMKNYNNIPLTEEEMMKLILDFYEQIDPEYYKNALKIIQCPTSLINFDSESKIHSQCVTLKYFQAPFIQIRETKDYKYCVFVHELQHGIDALTYQADIFTTFNELAAMFFEMIFIDRLNGLNDCEGLYSARVNDQVLALKALNNYANLLIWFDEHKRKFNKRSIYKLFNVKNREDLKREYARYMKADFNNFLRFVLSFFKCLEIREIYYKEGKEKAIYELKRCMTGKNLELNFTKLVQYYNDFIDELKTKQSSYQKTVK